MPSSEPSLLLVFDQGLATLAMALRNLLEAFSLATVVLGLLITLRQAGQGWRARRRGPSAFQAVRLTFGSWLAMALEFQLGADIVATSTSPHRRPFGAIGRGGRDPHLAQCVLGP